MSTIIKDIEERPEAIALPLDYEDRTLDIAIEVMQDIHECDECQIYIKWDQIPGGKRAPILYILFSKLIEAKCNKDNMPKLHLAPDGNLYPTHAILLTSQPSNRLIEGQKLKDHIRKGVEQFLNHYQITRTLKVNGHILEGRIKKRFH